MRNNRSHWKKQSMPEERETQHRNTEKLCRQPSRLRAGTAMGGIHWEPENAFGSDARRRHSPGHPAAPRASDTHRLMPQCEAISSSFPGTFHMVPLLHYVLAYSQGLCCPLECSHLPMQRPCCIYSPLSYTALDRKNHQSGSKGFETFPPKTHSSASLAFQRQTGKVSAPSTEEPHRGIRAPKAQDGTFPQ